jgi:hypothetical protein
VTACFCRQCATPCRGHLPPCYHSIHPSAHLGESALNNIMLIARPEARLLGLALLSIRFSNSLFLQLHQRCKKRG